MDKPTYFFTILDKTIHEVNEIMEEGDDLQEIIEEIAVLDSFHLDERQEQILKKYLKKFIYFPQEE